LHFATFALKQIKDMKIIVPMAGIGSRLRPHTLTVPKPLTLIAGKPIVQRLVENIAKIIGKNIKEIAFIIGPGFPNNTHDKLIEIATNLNTKGTVYIQNEALGTAHAIQCAKETLNGPCVVAFADTLFKADFSLKNSTDGAIWVKQVEDPSAYGVVKLQDGVISDFVEKPQEFVSDLAIIGIYYFKNGEMLRDEIQYLLDNNIKEKGEFQLTNALENLKKKGLKFVPKQVTEWMDCGNKEFTIKTNAKVLTFAKEDREKLISENVTLNNSTIVEPCYIGKNVILTNTTIGPFVSLGNNAVVENSIIRNSLIQSDVIITNATLENSMIGNHAVFNGNFKSVNIGDYSQITK